MAKSKRPLLRIIRIVWISAGIAITIWMYLSFQAKDVDEKTLQSDARISVVETDAEIRFTPTGPMKPVGLLFFPGGGVEPHAYAPLIRSVSENGYTAVIVKLPYRFAPFESHRREAVNRAHGVIAQTSNIDKWIVAGHSKGGKIASELVLDKPSSVHGLILIGTSHPKDFDLSHIVMPVKKIYASNDGVATVQMIESTKQNVPEHTRWVQITGGNHSQFGYYGPQLGDGSAGIERADQQRRTLEEILDTLVGVQETPKP